MPHLKAPSGIEWYYELEGDNEVLMFLHGWGCNLKVWTQQVRHFAPQRRVLALDFPGHGKSAWKKVNVSQLAEDISFAVEHLGIEQAHVVASSLGALPAMVLAKTRPEFFLSLTSVGSLPKFTQGKDYPFGLAPERVLKLRQQLTTDYPAIVQIFFRSLFTRKERASERFRWLESFRAQDAIPEREALETFLNFVEDEDRRQEFQELSLPLFFVNGTEDYICPLSSVEYLRSVHPEASVKLFEGCGHFPFLSQPAEFNSLLEKFLTECACSSNSSTKKFAAPSPGRPRNTTR